MNGYPLEIFSGGLSKIAEGEALFPISMRDKLLSNPVVQKSKEFTKLLNSSEWADVVKDLSFDSLEHLFSFEEIVRVDYANLYFFVERVRREIESLPRYRLIQKIKSSFWRWGENNDYTTWNTAVEVYKDIISFSLNTKDFEVTLDWTTGYKPRGSSESLRLFLDGVFGYFVHYKGEHVMTIGFSFTNKGELLLQQVQLVKSKGNRFLYQLGNNYFDWVVKNIRRHFSSRDIYIVDGLSLARLIESQYQSQVERCRDSFKYQARFMRMSRDRDTFKQVLLSLEYHYDLYKEYLRKVIEFRSCDLNRIVKIYGRIPSGCPSVIERNGLKLGLLK